MIKVISSSLIFLMLLNSVSNTVDNLFPIFLIILICLYFCNSLFTTYN